jgi:hypothetical protein
MIPLHPSGDTARSRTTENDHADDSPRDLTVAAKASFSLHTVAMPVPAHARGFPEGTRLTLAPHDDGPPVDLDPDEEAGVLKGIAEIAAGRGIPVRTVPGSFAAVP